MIKVLPKIIGLLCWIIGMCYIYFKYNISLFDWFLFVTLLIISDLLLFIKIKIKKKD